MFYLIVTAIKFRKLKNLIVWTDILYRDYWLTISVVIIWNIIIYRWQMRLMRDTSLPVADSIPNHMTRSRLQMDQDRGFSKPRDTPPCFQQTYIRRLPQATSSESSFRGCSLPALASRDQLPLTKPRKRSKLDLPAAASSNRTPCA